MQWNTRVTELLGCKYPIIEGALTGLGAKCADFAADVSKTGALGCIVAHSYKSKDKLRDAIKLVRDRTDNPFMVNLTLGIFGDQSDALEVCIEEQVPCIETAAFKPDEYVDRIKQSGIPWIHKAATVDFVVKAEKLGADAVVLVGIEGYGFKALKQLPTLTAISYAARKITVPLIAAGGIGDARTMLAALFAGADAVYMGSAFLATKECPFSDKIKENMIKAQPDNVELISELISLPRPEDYHEVMSLKGKIPLNEWLMRMEAMMLKQKKWKASDMVQGMSEENMFDKAIEAAEKDEKERKVEGRPKGPFSFVCGFIDKIPTVQEFIDEMVTEAEKIVKEKAERWGLDVA